MCGDVVAGSGGEGGTAAPHLSVPPLGSPPGSEETGAPPDGDRPPKAERTALWGRRILSPLREGAGDSPGRRKRDDRGRALAWAAPSRSGAVTTAPRQRHRVSGPAAAPSVLIRLDHAPTPPSPPLSLPSQGSKGRGGAEPAPTGSFRLGADGKGRAKGAL